MKLAAYFSTSPCDCRSGVEKMVGAMCLVDGQATSCFDVPGGAIGYVTGTERFSAFSLQRQAHNGNVLLISGVPIDLHGSLEVKLDEIVAGDYRSAMQKLQSLDGAYAAFFWDAHNEKLVIVNDCLGIQPLYIAAKNGVTLLATELKALPASGFIDVEIDPVGWGGFISLGFNIADRTQLAGVQLIDPATAMLLDSKTGRVETVSYWTFPEPCPDMQLADVDIPAMLEIMQREIACYAGHSREGTVLLSGGFDSRLILTLLKRLGIDCKVMTLVHPQHGFGIDGKYAVRIARELNCRDIDRVTPEKNYYSSPAYLRHLVMAEVVMPSTVLYMSTNVAAALKPEMKAVWEGLGPGFVFAPSYPRAGGFATYLQDRCKDRNTLHWQAVISTFSKATGQKMYAEFRQVLASEMGKYPDDDFGTARFQMSTQMRRYLAPSPLTVYANTVLPFTPGLSKEIWNLAGKIPLSVTSGMKLYMQVFKEHLPEAMTVPICSGGKLMSANSFAPELWLQARRNEFGRWSRYHWQRLPSLPVIGPVLEKSGLVSLAEREHNVLFDAVVQMISPDHPDLNADAVRRLQRAQPPFDWETRLGRRFLFYWQVWRWVMKGRLTTWNAETFMQHDLLGKD